MFWKRSCQLDSFFFFFVKRHHKYCANKFKTQMPTYMPTCSEFPRARKSDYQLFFVPTSEDIFGMNTSLRQCPPPPLPREEGDSGITAEITYQLFISLHPGQVATVKLFVVSREWKFISKNHYTLYHSIPHEHQSLLIRGPRTQASINNELPLILRGQVGERASVWIGSGSLRRPRKSMLTLPLGSCTGWLTTVISPPSRTHRRTQRNLLLLQIQ